jgi:ABC-type glutathione transport system ATPase component
LNGRPKTRITELAVKAGHTGAALVEPARATKPVVRLEDLRKSFGDNVVLDGIDLTVMAGEALVIIGPSGSGKSTLLRCVNLLEPVDSGRIFFEVRRSLAGESKCPPCGSASASSFSSSTSSRISACSTT